MRLAVVAHFRFRRFLLLTSEKNRLQLTVSTSKHMFHVPIPRTMHFVFRFACSHFRAPYEEFELKFAKHRCEIRFRLHRLTSEKLRVIWTVRVIFSLYQYRT